MKGQLDLRRRTCFGGGASSSAGAGPRLPGGGPLRFLGGGLAMSRF